MNKMMKNPAKGIGRRYLANRKVVEDFGHRTTMTSVKYDNGLEIYQAVRMPIKEQKSDRVDFLRTLVKHGYSKKDAAAECDISYSYATKLLRKK